MKHHRHRNPKVRTFVAWQRLALLVALVAYGCDEPARSPDTPEVVPSSAALVLDAEALRDAGIVTVAAKTLDVARSIEAPGVLVLDETRTARIGSLVEGKVLQVLAEVGDRVTAGERLATMHSPVVHEAWAGYRRAVAERKRAEAELAYARAAQERASRLFAAKAAALQEVQRADADRLTAEQTLEMARTDLRRAEEVLEHYGITSGDDPTGESGEIIPVESPIAGAVLERQVTAGSAVTTGTPLFVVSDLSVLWARAELEEGRLPLLRVGNPVEIRVAAYGAEVFPAQIVFVADTLDPVTRRVSVRCRVDNTDGRLRPQMFANVSLKAPTQRRIVAVPDEAVQTLDNRTVVFLETAPGRFEPIDVDLGGTFDGWTEVVTGVAAGDRIAAGGSVLLNAELRNRAGGGEE